MCGNYFEENELRTNSSKLCLCFDSYA